MRILALKSRPLMYLSQMPMASQKMLAHYKKNLYARCKVHCAPEITFKFSLFQAYLVIRRLACMLRTVTLSRIFNVRVKHYRKRENLVSNQSWPDKREKDVVNRQ